MATYCATRARSPRYSGGQSKNEARCAASIESSGDARALAVRAAAEDDDEPPGAQRPDDLGEMVLVGDAAERGLEPRLLPQDRGLQTLEGRPGLDAELLDEGLAGVLVAVSASACRPER